jgi:general secretion pathway protein E
MGTENETVFTLDQAIERLGLTRAQVYRQMKDGGIKATKVDGGPRFSEKDLLALEEVLKKKQTDLAEALDRWLATLGERLTAGGVQELPEVADGTPEERTAEVVRRIILLGIVEGAADIHIDPLTKGSRLLWRRGGALKETGRLEPALSDPVKAGLKTSAGITDPEQTAATFVHSHNDHAYQIRLKVAPTPLGEHLHLHLFEAAEDVSLQSLGYTPDQAAAIDKALSGPPGLFLAAFAVDSAASLHRLAIASRLAQTGRLVISLEHEIQYRSELLVQIEIGPEPGDFETAVSTALEMGPDVLMVDGVREGDQIRTLLQAVTAGAITFAHIRESGAISAMERLLNEELSRIAFADALLGIVERRTLHRLCDACKAAKEADGEEARRLSVAQGTQLYEPRGCEACLDGFAGKRAAYGLWLPDEALVRTLMKFELPADRLADWDTTNPLSLASAARQAVLAGDVSLAEAANLLR